MKKYLARTAFVFSGVAGLMFEIVWMRHLCFSVGATTVAIATTTAAYMGGLAFGSYLGGKLSDRIKRPLLIYGGLECIIALIGLGVPQLCSLIPLLDEIWLSDLSSGFLRILIRFGAAMFVLIIPTTAMGMTLPILARVVAERAQQVGSEVGLLYALNIAGAVLGAAFAGFVSIPHVGLFATNLTAVGIDSIIGVISIVLGYRVLCENPVMQVQINTTKEPSNFTTLSRPLLGMLFITGTTAMVLQVLWVRAIGTALGPSTYAFSAIVCTYLAGLSMGSAWAAWFNKRFIQSLADSTQRILHTRQALIWVLLCCGFFSLLGIVWVDDLPLLLQYVVLDESLTMGGLVRTEFALAALTVLPATIGMGAIFPLVLSEIADHGAPVGAVVGYSYTINTLGNIFGSAAAVFLLLPLLGVEWSMRTATLFYLVVASGLVWSIRKQLASKIFLTLSVAIIGISIWIVFWPSWNIAQWTSGMFRMSMARYYFPDGWEASSKLIFYEDGLASTVTVEEEGGVRWIKVNGKIDGSSEGDMPTQILSGILPLLFHDDPKKIAVIGCGSGVTAGYAYQASRAEVTLVEIEAQVLRAAKLFQEVNQWPNNDRRFRLVEDDGRNFLTRPGTPYDIIISEPSNPWMTGAASLFTQEFFKSAKNRLRPNGIFLQWLQIYELAPDRIASVLKTIHSVFPYVLVFTPQADSNDLLILGKQIPWSLNQASLTQRFDSLTSYMAKASVERLAQLLSLLLFSDEQIIKLHPGIPLNTDDNAYIEFGAPQDLLLYAEKDPDVKPIQMMDSKRYQWLHAQLGAESVSWLTLGIQLAFSYLHNGMFADAKQAGQSIVVAPSANAMVKQKARTILQILEIFEEVEDRKIVIDKNKLSDDEEYAWIAKLMQRGEEEQALANILEKTDFSQRSGAHALLKGYLLYRAGRYQDARKYLLLANSMEPEPSVLSASYYYLARESYLAGELNRAVNEMLKYYEIFTTSLSPTPTKD